MSRSLDIRAPSFLDRASLDGEFGRVFDLCHQCRRCFDLCPSFDVLFKRIDQTGEDASGLTAADNKQVLDLCYQCKLCYNHCPYTPPHDWAIDFPRLMLRAKAVEVKERGRVTSQDKALGNTDLIGRLGSALAPLSNWANRNPINRIIVEKIAGIHRDRTLPEFHRETFSKWFKRRKAVPSKVAGDAGAVSMFYTCNVEYHGPRVGRAAVEVLERALRRLSGTEMLRDAVFRWRRPRVRHRKRVIQRKTFGRPDQGWRRCRDARTDVQLHAQA
jgi:glycerol-3-phosphate dehydrogenase subunit C